ncbi:family 4 glycosyl hydrolase [Vallitalea okinawensis]|uniref:family 4 glycosyl hydrolase n=1 Tax=Vallitalea okinawensis TaxID=2078660 RepID=UPI000CFC64E0|nr:glycoside hydrolase family 4 [Vallitalea okinawensis]
MTKTITNPKIVLIGAGSLFFGRQAIWQMVHSEYLNNGTLALVDTDEERLNKMTKLAQMVVECEGVNVTIESSVKARDVLPGADFVVLSFAEKSVYYRGIDCEISEKHGIRMCSGDTIGPGGIFRAMRELPVIMAYTKDIEELCPEAWVINYINPTAVHGMALKRFAPNLKSFALCDGLHMPHIKRRYAVRAGIINSEEDYSDTIAKDFDFRIAGVNHFTWCIKAEYQGKDVMKNIAEYLRINAAKETDGGDVGAKGKFNDSIGYELYKAFGYVPVCVGHTKEYVRFWQGRQVLEQTIPPLTLWETEARYKRHEAMWDQVDDFISGKTPIEEYMTTFGPDHATDIIENMVGNLGKKFYINTYNNGAVTNMNDDAFLELLCEPTLDGIYPVQVGEMPRGIKGMEELVLDTHELTAEAVVKGSRDLLKRAMLTDPLACSISDIEKIIEELLEAEKDQIPDIWYE